MSTYEPKHIEKKWQEIWKEKALYKTAEQIDPKNKMYILPQLPYPSGSGLHVGHAEVYTACDIYARYQRMIGKDVLQVIGWDAFGLPAENYAIKTNVHPRKSTNDAIDNFREQIKLLGISVDWDREVGSHNPDYYKWTQWFFLLMYKRGLAYRKKQSVNWCDSCKTVLANEQVTNAGTCERCDTVVVQKEMEQWYLKITDYADRLLEGLDRIDWPEETKKRQRDWIGKSEGAEIDFRLQTTDKGQLPIEDDKVTVFTTRPDTLFGATYMVLAPEHDLIQKLSSAGSSPSTIINNWDEVDAYIKKTAERTELDRQIDQEKTGVELKGIQAIHPISGEPLPVWIADYVLASYGSGAIMAVPAHDERDFAFAKKFGLEIKQVVEPIALRSDFKEGEVVDSPLGDKYYLNQETEFPFVMGGRVINSDFLDRLTTPLAKEKIISYLEEKGIGKRKTQYKLRDWSVSRQRFWGAPIPMLFNEERKNKKYHYILVHGFTGRAENNFFPWLKQELEAQGHSVWCKTLPNPDEPSVEEQANFVLSENDFTENTVILGHSLGGAVVMHLLEKIDTKIAKAILIDSFYHPNFEDKDRPFVEKSFHWKFDFEKIKQAAEEFVLLADDRYETIPKIQSEKMQHILNARLITAHAQEEHFCANEEPVILEYSIVDGFSPVPEQNLPVILPDDVDFKPTGESPLRYSESFNNGVEEQYGKGWKREPDTLDTFMCSSWYYYRYLDPNNDQAFASPEVLKQWMPVDFYLGGAEHVNGHLLYARFFTKVLYDAGYIDFDEPFTVNRHQGLILGEDNRKMSKRWGNVINPTDVVNEYGADTCRMYEMFMGPLEETKPWSTGGVKGIRRFLEKVWNLPGLVAEQEIKEIDAALHKLIKKVGEDTSTLQFNTAIAKMMEFVNAVQKQGTITKQQLEMFIMLLAPYAPHIAEELWETLGHSDSVTTQAWPQYDEQKIVEESFTLAVQVNGKLRATVDVAAEISEEEAKTIALAQENVQKWMEGKEAKKVIYIKGKLVSIVI